MIHVIGVMALCHQITRQATTNVLWRHHSSLGYNYNKPKHKNDLNAVYQICTAGVKKCIIYTYIIYLYMYIGQVTELWLSCYLVLLSIDNKTR